MGVVIKATGLRKWCTCLDQNNKIEKVSTGALKVIAGGVRFPPVSILIYFEYEKHI